MPICFCLIPGIKITLFSQKSSYFLKRIALKFLHYIFKFVILFCLTFDIYLFLHANDCFT